MQRKLKLIAFILSLPLVALIISPKIESQTKAETAAQKFKSIKVLNDMPADQMGKVMNQMSASLGVSCNFCHTSNDGDYEKEGIEHKNTAREMIKMTFDLNKRYFNGRPEINCNSCHNGKSHPQPSFPLVPFQAAEERPKQPEKKPSVEQILDKYIAALGGKAKLSKISSRYIKASRIEPDGKTIEPEEIWQKGNKSLIKTTYGNYVVSEVFDGEKAWKKGNADLIELKDDEAEQIRREAELSDPLNLSAVFSKLEYAFLDKINGREVYVLRATTKKGSRERLVFDAASGLLVRRSASSPTILGNFVYQVDYEDYKDFGGVKLPATIKFAVPNIYWSRKIIEVKNNTAIDDTKFSK